MTTLGTVFVSDTHLGLKAGARHRLFVAFLREIASRAHTLCLLGDIFDIWVKPSHSQFPAFRPVLDELSRLRRAGVTIHFFEGNRDYFGTRFLRDHVGVTVHRRATQLAVEGRRVLVTHGDDLCDLDTNYHIVRILTRNPLTYGAFASLPAEVSYYLARGYKRYSSRARARKETHRMDLSPKALIRRFREGAQDIVCGHVHRSCKLTVKGPHNLGDNVGAVYVVGNWQDDSGRYLTLKNGRFTCRQFRLDRDGVQPTPPVPADA